MKPRSHWGQAFRLVGRANAPQPAADRQKTARWGHPAPPALFSLLMFAACLSAQSQSYSIDWFKIAGGGGTSTGATYQVTGTIGQPEAGVAMSGGSYSLTGGFWSLIAVVQTAGAPLLTVAHSGNSVTVSWPLAAAGFALQQNNNLANPTGWSVYSGTVSTNNGVNRITLTPPVGNLFFRLKQ